MRSSRSLFRLFGIDIRIHFTWWFVVILLSWSLATAYFPLLYPEMTPKQYWIMGVIASLLLFVSVLLHELSHSLVAKWKKIPVENITLFFFGGVAGITKEDIPPKTEFVMAIAGPLFSLLLSGVFYSFTQFSISQEVLAIALYLSQLNLVLAVFNMVPGFPLDGGRAFRALLYYHYKDLRKATKIAVTAGRIFAVILIVWGIVSVFNGGNGLWFVLLGLFLYFIAGLSYDQVVLREALYTVPVQEVLRKRIVTLDADMTLADFFHRHKGSEEMIFIVRGKEFFGLLDIRLLGRLQRGMSLLYSLKQVSLPLSRIKVLKRDDTAYTALQLLNEQQLEGLPVVEKDRILGVVLKSKVLNTLFWRLHFSR